MCLQVERWWSRPFRNFDNVGNAMLTLFTVMTLDSWMDVARSCIDAVDVDKQPQVCMCMSVFLPVHTRTYRTRCWMMAAASCAGIAAPVSFQECSIVPRHDMICRHACSHRNTLFYSTPMQVNHAPWMGLYIIAFFFLGSLFWVNLLASTVVEYYTKLVAEKGDVLTSKKQRVRQNYDPAVL